jgi:hypothetical protein
MGMVPRLEVSTVTQFGESFYPGDEGHTDRPFRVTEWIRLQRALIPAELAFRMIAGVLGLEFTTNIRGAWPSRGVRWRKEGECTELRLMLNPRYDQDTKLFFQLNANRYATGFLGIGRKDISNTVLRVFDMSDLDDPELINRELREQIALLLPPPK